MKPFFLFVMIAACLPTGLFAQTATVTTQNNEQFQVEVKSIKEDFLRFKQTTINEQLMEKLPLSYVSSISFLDGYCLHFDKGKLQREDLLNAPFIKKGFDYKVEGLVPLTQDEMISLMGERAYWNGYKSNTGMIGLGIGSSLSGVLLIGLGHILTMSYEHHPATENGAILSVIVKDYQYAMKPGPLIMNKTGLSFVIAGLTEFTVGSIGLNRFNKNYETMTFPSLEKRRRQFYAGSALALAGTATLVSGILLWNNSFNPARQYSYFSSSFVSTYYDSSRGWLLKIAEVDNGRSGSLTGMWMSLAGAAALHVGLSLAVPAIPALRHADNLSLACGFTPNGYGLSVRF